jgi:hypothetical protein
MGKITATRFDGDKMSPIMSRLPRALLSFALLFLAGGSLGVACGSPLTDCQLDPLCGSGGVGSYCNDDRDCAYGGGHCCESKNCDRGMCTYECSDDRDCPSEMRCEHSVCFYACLDDRDCAAGQRCEHGDTVCEWD